jgi:hypothetical protein
LQLPNEWGPSLPCSKHASDHAHHSVPHTAKQPILPIKKTTLTHNEITTLAQSHTCSNIGIQAKKCKHSQHQLHAQHDSLVFRIDVCPLRDQTLNGRYVSFFSCQMNGSPLPPDANTRQITPLIQSHTHSETTFSLPIKDNATQPVQHKSANILVMKLMQAIIRRHQLHPQLHSLVFQIDACPL